MDRFIGILKLYNDKTMLNFKIQYGQIYSEMGISDVENMQHFKIQYGQIYSCNVLSSLLRDRDFKIQYGQIYSDYPKRDQLLYTAF